MKLVSGLIPGSLKTFYREQKHGKPELTEEQRSERAQRIIAKTLRLADPPQRSKWRLSAAKLRRKVVPAVSKMAAGSAAHLKDVCTSIPARFSFGDALSAIRFSTDGSSGSRRYSDVGIFGTIRRRNLATDHDETLSLLDVEYMNWST